MDEPELEGRRPAAWSTRVGAWLIDVVLLGAFVAVLGDLLGVGPGLLTLAHPLDATQHSLLLFVYWTLFETNAGQSPGKLALDLQVVGQDGHPPSLIGSAVQSFGKAFLLPLDVVVGLLAMPGERRRLFHRLSGTRVVELDEPPRSGGATATAA